MLIPDGNLMDFADDPERTLALTYVRDADRKAVAALFALDDAMASLLRTTTDPAIAQIRMAWWREELVALGRKAVPAMPVFTALAQDVLPRGVSGAELAKIVEGWEVLIEAERLDRQALADYAAGRGGRMFALAARLTGAEVDSRIGEGWALADLAGGIEDATEALVAREMAIERLSVPVRWPRATRALGAMAAIAEMNMALPPRTPPPIGAPRRVARLAWLRITGR